VTIPTETQAEQPSLSRRAASGVAWSGISVLLSKVFALGTQIVLAWLLLPADFGIFALTLTVAGFINLIREAGILPVATKRQNEFESLKGPIFWISIMVGLIAELLMLTTAEANSVGYSRKPLSGNALNVDNVYLRFRLA